MEADGGLAEGAAPGLKTATLLVLVGGLQSCSQVSSAALCWDENRMRMSSLGSAVSLKDV